MNRDANNVKEKMNEYGKEHIPFLFIIDYEMIDPLVQRLEDVDPDKILFDVNGSKNYQLQEIITRDLHLKKYPVSYQQYKKSFDVVRKAIEEGNTYLANLTFPTRIETNFGLKEIFFLSRAKFKLYVKDKFVLYSPEEFVRIENGTISSFPMKGTIDASTPNARELIIADEKETAEHTTIVDLIRNDLSIVAKDVHVKRFRFIDEITTKDKSLLQVSSEICGTLPVNYNEQIGNVIFEMLPAGSISGAPKKKTLEVIAEAEISPRGFYTGVFGIFDGINLYSAVMIRFIEKIDNELIYRSGGGITYLSNPEMEYNELIEKVYVPIG